MGYKVVIRFFGLCVHVQKNDFPDLPARHRVILLSNPAPVDIDCHTIHPHQPALTFLNTEPAIDLPCVESLGQGSFRLNGVRMRITNGIETFARSSTFERIPHLTPLGGVLPPPNPDVILFGGRPAAGYFDVDHGTFQACISTPKGAVGTSLVIDTGSETPKLELSCFGTQIVDLGPEATLHITNVAANSHDDEYDYLLNYQILQSIPAFTPTPRPDIEGLTRCAPDTNFDFGPPCSNSNYP